MIYKFNGNSSMDIWALKGHKVKYTEWSSKNGTDSDKEQATRLLEIDKEYTVEYTRVGGSCSSVALQEFPDETFNTVNFEDVVQQSDEDDTRHPDYATYN